MRDAGAKSIFVASDTYGWPRARRAAVCIDEVEFETSNLMGAPRAQLASHGGDFAVDALAGASNPAYLEETPEVQITAAIEAKAAELDHDPVAIHAWVRNNVAWIPSWGATQSADHTLSSQRGNAMDIASLEIALLRASDIPARYAVGTIEVEAERFTNWAGGFDTIEAAADYAASGGLPIETITEAGRIERVRMA
jgi:transglutaminase-like putative cysteine protease